MPITVTAVVFGLIGIALGAPGAWLVMLGGSWFYLGAGLGFLVTAWLLFARRSSALSVYAFLLAATLVWAIWEIGFDWWQLATRGGLVVLAGLWLLLPVIRRRLTPGGGAAPLMVAVLAAVAVAGYSMTTDTLDLAGQLPTEAVTATPNLGPDAAPGEWRYYGNTQYGQRYSPLTQITPANVATLEPAWVYQTGDLRTSTDVPETTYQVTPLKVDDTLYICTPHNFAIAIEAATGAEKWRFDPKIAADPDRQHQTCRGVGYYADPAVAPGQPCAQRVYLPTSDARLIALDAETGKICPAFGAGGTVDLYANMPFQQPGYYYSTSAPLVAGGKIIVGGAVNDNFSADEPSGVIRAYDLGTGALVWNWDSGNPTETTPIAAGEVYTQNSPNMWSTASADEALGLVYLPIGNKTPDQLGMNRSPEDEAVSSSVVALDLATGQMRWVHQMVHHDLWDMDTPAQPVLIDITSPEGEVTPALVQVTKQGDVHVLDRRSGVPIIPVREIPAPQGAIEGDFTAPTQPISDLTFSPPPLTGKDMWGVSLFDQLACRIALKRLRYEGRYTPPSLEGSLIYPGNFGVFNWGSVAVDPVRQVMFGMPTYLAFTSKLVPRDQVPPPGPVASEQGVNQNTGLPYGVEMGPFLSPLGIPCQAPPWGYVAGVDLRTGDIAWKHRNGTIRDMTPLPLPFKVGVPGIGGPIITAGGVAFLGAAVDDYIRGYDLTTGAELWRARLPAGGQSTPMSYEEGGRQYVVIVAGGHGSIGTKAGDYVLAYTLPE